MKKLALSATTALTLSACMGMDAPNPASVARLDTLSASCGNPHMGTLNNLPMRCGPQVALPYTLK